jgi:2'-5' RNA ligase
MVPEAQPSEALRLFVAIELPRAVREAVCEGQSALRGALRGSRASWTRPEQFHLTLKFLGAVDAADAEAIAARLSGVAGICEPPQLAATGVGFFPSARSPRVAWVGIRAVRGDLGGLQAAVEQAVGAYSEQEAEGRFHAHVTLARIKEFARGEALALGQWMSGWETVNFGTWVAPELLLMKSVLAPKGAVHTAVARLPFQGCGPGRMA